MPIKLSVTKLHENRWRIELPEMNFICIIYIMNPIITVLAAALSTAVIQLTYTPLFPDNYQFLDVFRNTHEMTVNRQVPENQYNPECYSYIDTDNDGRIIADSIDASSLYSYKDSDHTTQTLGYTGFIKYEDDIFTSKVGIDVSKFQKKINWEKVKSAGIDFAFVRVAYRGYGKAGSLNEDAYYRDNIEGAKAAGLEVGAYIYSQAVNEEEAVEEADYICRLLDGYDLDLPVVYDPEHVVNDTARTDNVSGEQFTKNARAFCDRVKELGYEPMIYANMLWEAYELDISAIEGVPLWYADYENLPQTPYSFRIWQYSQAGRVSGISGTVDMNLMIVPK